MRRGELKRGGYFLKTDDRGASLIAVVVALVFVLTMAAIITEITTTNIRLREFEVAEKENFYGADAIMEDLRSKMAPIAMQKMEISYSEMLSVYGDVLSRYAERGEGSQKLAQAVEKEFNQIYIDNLAEYFRDPQTDESTEQVIYENASGDGKKKALYRMGKYNDSLIKEALKENSQYFNVSKDDMIFTADYANGLFALKNIRIVYSDPSSSGYETWVTTDLVFKTPVFQFDDGSEKSFMDYALIADTKIEAATGNNSTVTGSVYAGAGGIASTSNTKPVDFSGDNIVTRGDIVVNGSSVLTFGLNKSDGFEGTTHIWAQNIRIDGASALGSSADINLVMKGEINVEDDLMLNGTNSSAKLCGSYNGYNFRENYIAEGEAENKDQYDPNPSAESFFSSAIMINGSDCRLDITGLDHLYLAGRAFISRGSKISSNNKDILLGESLSVRADQLAYLVSERFLKITANGDGDVTHAEFSEEGIVAYEDATGVKISDYLENGSLEVMPYRYRNQIASTSTQQKPVVQYYLYFKNAGDANDFFVEYWNAFARDTTGGARLSGYEKDYAAAILLNSNSTLLTLSGDLLYRNEPDGDNENEGFVLGQHRIADSGWKSPVGNAFHVYWERSDMLARTYKSLQTYLVDDYTKVPSADVRFAADGFSYPDKKEDSLFENHLIDEQALRSFLGSFDSSWSDCTKTGSNNYTVVTIKGSITGKNGTVEDWEAVICDNESSNAKYQINSSGTSAFNGIVIATGDVEIVDEVNGLVISGGTIRLGGSNVKVKSDAELVQEIFDEVIMNRKYGSQFADIFSEYQPISMYEVSGAKIGDYLLYENWTKNEGTLPDNGVTEP